jgi:hypothetical protein
MRLLSILVFIFAVFVLASPVRSATITLYDGSLGNAPGAQSFVLLSDPLPFFPHDWTETVENGGVTLDSMPDESEKVGYFADPDDYGALDRSAGYTLRFTVQIVSESHSSNDRAGFSVIVLSDDLEGIELGFWQDKIWAQTDVPRFTQAEGSDTDTTTLRTYDLTILGDTYTLSSGGEELLSGPLRNYSAEGEPYNVEDLIFLGDDTTSARAKIRLTAVDLILPLPPASTTTPTFTFTAEAGTTATASATPTFTPGPGTPSATPTFTPGPGTPSATPTFTPGPGTPSATPTFTPGPGAPTAGTTAHPTSTAGADTPVYLPIVVR